MPSSRLGPLRLVAAGLLAGAVLAAPGGGAQAAPAPQLAPVSPYLARTLPSLTGSSMVMVHGASLADAARAVRTVGLARVTSFDKIGVVVARGSKAQIQAVRTQPGVTYVEGNQPIEFLDDTSNTATRGLEAAQTLTGADGTALTGRGVSVAVIDSGVDPTHPAFAEADGGSAVVANLKTLCDPFEFACTVQEVPNVVDTDTLSAGGHGTHVNGIVAGRPTSLADGTTQRGAATDAKLVSISTGAGIVIIGADAALNWVLENHAAPCGAGVAAAECPPIKVTNNSYGPSGGGEFDPNSATVKLQRALAAEGVVTVWANGNDGGNGSTSLSNPPGMDPTGGIISVASYFDQDTGTRDGSRLRLLLPRRGRQPVDLPRHLRPRRGHHLGLPPLPGDLLDRPRPAQRPGRARHRHLQHDQRHLDGRPAHRGHRGAAVPGRPDGDARRDRGGSEVHRVQVHRRRGLRGRPARHDVLRQGLRPGRRRGRGAVAGLITSPPSRRGPGSSWGARVSLPARTRCLPRLAT